MRYATKAAFDAVPRFTENAERQELLRHYLSEAPIGDEYDTMTEAEWDYGGSFETWLTEQGISAWE